MSETLKHRLLTTLDELRRKVETGEVTAMVAVVGCEDGYVLSRVTAVLPPHGILLLQDITNESRERFLNANNQPDDGGPRLGVAKEDSPA